MRATVFEGCGGVDAEGREEEEGPDGAAAGAGAAAEDEEAGAAGAASGAAAGFTGSAGLGASSGWERTKHELKHRCATQWSWVYVASASQLLSSCNDAASLQLICPQQSCFVLRSKHQERTSLHKKVNLECLAHTQTHTQSHMDNTYRRRFAFRCFILAAGGRLHAAILISRNFVLFKFFHQHHLRVGIHSDCRGQLGEGVKWAVSDREVRCTLLSLVTEMRHTALHNAKQHVPLLKGAVKHCTTIFSSF